MKITFTRKTGFYGMGSPIQLRINDQNHVSLNHDQSVQIETQAPFTMQIVFYWLKSPVYTVTDPKEAYVITMNLLVLQIYPFLFLGTAIGMFYWQNWLYSLAAAVLLIGFFFYIKNRTYAIKEERHGKF